jgi:Zn-dependent peptidase ImmA (M78 family)
MAFNPEMLRLGRVGRGMKQAELASALNTTQGRIAKWEDGFLKPSDNDVERLVTVLRFPRSFWEHDTGTEAFGTCCMYHRKRQSLPAGFLNTIHARVNIIGLAIVRLLRNVSMDSPLAFPSLDIDEFGSPARVATLLRRHWKIPPGPIRNLIQYVESAGGIVAQLDFGTDKLDAVSLWPREARPLFFINSASPTDRWRFTLSHEIAHLVMHSIPTPDAEREADDFASEFLMPVDDIRQELSQMSLVKAARLKLRWRVSMQAIIRKAHDSGAISARKYRSLYTALSAAGYRKREPGEVGSEAPQTLQRLIETHRKHLGYSESQLLELLFCVDAEQFAHRFQGRAAPLRIVTR